MVATGESIATTQPPVASFTSSPPFTFSWDERLALIHSTGGPAPPGRDFDEVSAARTTDLQFKVFDTSQEPDEGLVATGSILLAPRTSEHGESASAASVYQTEQSATLDLYASGGGNEACGTLSITVSYCLQGFPPPLLPELIALCLYSDHSS
jgi:hypothetical protein